MHPKNVIYVLCFLLFAVGCHTEKKGHTYQSQKVLYSTNTPDSIFNYPYDDGIWVTIKTTNQDKVASIIGLDTFTSANWAYGFKTSKNNNRKESSVFISPVINNNWILISGYNLPHARLNDVEPFLNALSKEFGEAHYYLNHEKTYCIAKSKNGILERFARYHDIRDLIEKGTKTKAEELTKMGDISIEYNVNSVLTKEYNKNPAKFERKYKHVNHVVETLDESDVYLADTIPWPNKNYVNRIAKLWSFNPKRMTEQGFSSEGLGLHGRIR